MRSVLLAGGRGTRLRPYTTVLPKPLVPLGEMAVMEVLLRRLARAGCTRATVAVGHLAHLIMAYFGDGTRWGVPVDYSQEDAPLGTVGPLTRIPDLPEHFLVLNGDLLTDLDLRAFFDHHVASGALATIGTYERGIRIDFGILSWEGPEHRIIQFTEKPEERFSVSMGVYAFSRRILDLVPRDRPFGFDELMGRCVAEALDVRAYPFNGYWLDIGRPEDYERASRDFDGLRARLLDGEGPP
ncbi:MAG: NTP transferase domain-containing protein [Deltaproteobacteria bacterium]|nr:NTP transferase domain-containing protein [Deltaproteobacteria bacterium]